MDQGSLLHHLAQVRRQVTTLCHKERFSAAHVFLTGSGMTVEAAPGLWEYIARQAAQAGHSEIAHRLRESLWQAGLLSDAMALQEAAFFLDNEDTESCTYVLEAHFGALPQVPLALEYLTRAYMQAASADKSAGKLRTSRAVALRLTENVTPSSPAHAIAAVDLLRFSDEIDRSIALNTAARGAFPDDIRFAIRDARIAEQKGHIDSAIALWAEVEAQSDRYRIEALFKLLSLHMKRENTQEVLRIAARLTQQDLPVDARLRLALMTGQDDVALAITQYVATNASQTDCVSYAQGKAIGDMLLENGQIGLVVWLRRQRMALSDHAKSVLDACKFGEDLALPFPNSFEEAAHIRSPDFMLPIRDFLHMPPKPTGWPAPRQDPGQILLVNSSLKSGGAERQFVALARALCDAGVAKDQINVALFNLDPDRGRDHFLADLEALGVTIHDLSQRQIANPHLPGKVARVIGALPAPLHSDVRQLWHLCQKLKPDVIHGWQDRSAAASGLVADLADIDRVVLSMRNMAPGTRRDRSLTMFKPLLQTWAPQANMTLTANAAAGASDYQGWLGLPEGTVKTLRNAVNLDAFQPVFDHLKSRGPSSGPLRIGGVFRLALNKRPLLWLETVAALRDQMQIDVAPRIFGEGPLYDQIKARAAALNLDELTITSGASDPMDIYGDLDMLLLMSRVEGIPNVLLEAQACGLPVAACDVGGVREAMQNRGDAQALVLDADVTPTAAATALAKWLPTARAAEPFARNGFVRTHYAPDTLAQACLQYFCQTGARADGE